MGAQNEKVLTGELLESFWLHSIEGKRWQKNPTVDSTRTYHKKCSQLTTFCKFYVQGCTRIRKRNSFSKNHNFAKMYPIPTKLKIYAIYMFKNKRFFFRVCTKLRSSNLDPNVVISEVQKCSHLTTQIFLLTI